MFFALASYLVSQYWNTPLWKISLGYSSIILCGCFLLVCLLSYISNKKQKKDRSGELIMVGLMILISAVHIGIYWMILYCIHYTINYGIPKILAFGNFLS